MFYMCVYMFIAQVNFIQPILAKFQNLLLSCENYKNCKSCQKDAIIENVAHVCQWNVLNGPKYHLKPHFLVGSEFAALYQCWLEVGVVLDRLAILVKQVNFILVFIWIRWISMEHVSMVFEVSTQCLDKSFTLLVLGWKILHILGK